MGEIGIHIRKPFPIGKSRAGGAPLLFDALGEGRTCGPENVFGLQWSDRGNSPESPDLPCFKISDLDLRWEVGGGPTVSGTSSSLPKPCDGLNLAFGLTSFCKSCQPVASESSSAFHSNWCFKTGLLSACPFWCSSWVAAVDGNSFLRAGKFNFRRSERMEQVSFMKPLCVANSHQVYFLKSHKCIRILCTRLWEWELRPPPNSNLVQPAGNLLSPLPRSACSLQWGSWRCTFPLSEGGREDKWGQKMWSCSGEYSALPSFSFAGTFPHSLNLTLVLDSVLWTVPSALGSSALWFSCPCCVDDSNAAQPFVLSIRPHLSFGQTSPPECLPTKSVCLKIRTISNQLPF